MVESRRRSEPPQRRGPWQERAGNILRSARNKFSGDVGRLEQCLVPINDPITPEPKNVSGPSGCLIDNSGKTSERTPPPDLGISIWEQPLSQVFNIFDGSNDGQSGPRRSL